MQPRLLEQPSLQRARRVETSEPKTRGEAEGTGEMFPRACELNGESAIELAKADQWEFRGLSAQEDIPFILLGNFYCH